MAAMGVGALIAGIGIAVRGKRQPGPRLLLVQRLMYAAAVIVLAFAGDLRLALVALAVLGYGLIAQLTVTNTMIQWLAPDSLRGRIVSTYTWALGGFWPLGALLLGVIGQRIGVSQTFLVAGVACAVITLIGWRAFPVPDLSVPPVPLAEERGRTSETQ